MTTVPTVISIQVFADVSLSDVEPYEAEVIMSSYQRVKRVFLPEWVKASWSQSRSFEGEPHWLRAEVHGHIRRKGTDRFTTHARVLLDEDENGLIWHWPAYAREAMAEARKVVTLP